MTFRKEVLQNFIDKLLSVVPGTVAVYSFKRHISRYDKWLKDKAGLVIIIDEMDNFQRNFMLIDLIYDSIQDEFGWEGGLD
ncbi:MAG: hypothetical protein KGD64_06795, partial [Candidatus Heimdallarchaeota archaeon]|nr:hypothetical protein [Candidatus Heimdallarchaeota archaeon]